MTSAKNYTIVFAVAVSLLIAGNAKADLCVSISDANSYNDNVNLFQLFNDYFADQLGQALYTNSNDLFSDRGVDPYTTWTTSGSQLVGAFKVAALGHTMSLDDSSGNNITSFVHYGGTNGLGMGGITDLSGQSFVDIADGLSVGFRLDADWNGSLVYSWSSNPDENADGQVHMVAIDITDLYNAKYGTVNDSVYMFAWEDLHLTGANGGGNADWDYQDFVVIMTNVRPDDGSAPTPEPATLAIVGLGLAGLGWARARRGRK